MSLAALLGLAGGAQGLSGGLSDLSRRKEAQDEERKKTALQLLLAGWQPTPTAQGHPNAVGMLAHGNGAVDVLNDLKAPQAAMQRTGGDGYHVSQDASSSTPDAAPQSPETIDVPDMGSYQRTPQAALRDLLAIQGPQATIRHLNAETNALEGKPTVPQTVAPGTGVWNRTTGKYDVPVPAANTDHFTFPTGMNAAGKPVVLRGNTRTGEIGPTDVAANPSGSGGSGTGLGAGGIAGAGRALAAVKGLHTADRQARPFEAKVASGAANLTDLDFFQTQLASLYSDQAQQTGVIGHIVPFFGTATGSAVLARLNRTNPELANYLQSMATWALEESTLTNRPSDFRTKMDEFVSSLKPNAGIQSIHNLWESRSNRLQGYDQMVPALQATLQRMAGSAGAPGPAAAPDSRPPIADLLKP